MAPDVFGTNWIFMARIEIAQPLYRYNGKWWLTYFHFLLWIGSENQKLSKLTVFFSKSPKIAILIILSFPLGIWKNPFVPDCYVSQKCKECKFRKYPFFYVSTLHLGNMSFSQDIISLIRDSNLGIICLTGPPEWFWT